VIGDVCALDWCGVMVGWTTAHLVQWSPGILTSSVVRSTLTASKTGLFRSYYEKNEVMMPADDASGLSARLGLGVEDAGAKKRQRNVSPCTVLSKRFTMHSLVQAPRLHTTTMHAGAEAQQSTPGHCAAPGLSCRHNQPLDPRQP
jgi:hypothetical protein